MDLVAQVDAIVVAWVARHGARLERRPGDTWILFPAADLDGGRIGVILRPNEHGRIEVAPSNDHGWFERFGCEVAGLAALLDTSLGFLESWVGREDPYQGLP